jgi:tRNA (cmo5U34)-methyltransferase
MHDHDETKLDLGRFEFSDFADEFDTHIADSIPDYPALRAECLSLSRRFIQSGTTVLDVGCSTGQLLGRIRDHNAEFHQGVQYVGIDVEPSFAEHWTRRAEALVDLRYQTADIRSEQPSNLSLALSLFTIQFLPEKDKIPVLKALHEGLVTGGGIIIAEKILATSARLQEAFTSRYHQKKRERFSPEHVLDKEAALYGYMTSWTEAELVENLLQVGFRDVQSFWSHFPFKAFVALK